MELWLISRLIHVWSELDPRLCQGLGGTTCPVWRHGMQDPHLKMQPGNQKYHTGQPEALHHKLILGHATFQPGVHGCVLNSEVGEGMSPGMSIMDQLLGDDE